MDLGMMGKKVGPLPLGVWIVGIGGGLAWSLFQKKQDRDAAAAAAVEAANVAAAGISGPADYLIGARPPATPAFPGNPDAGRPAGPVDNQAWRGLAFSALVGAGFPAGASDLALGKYLSGAPLTPQERALVDLALTRVGAPPVAPPLPYAAAPPAAPPPPAPVPAPPPAPAPPRPPVVPPAPPAPVPKPPASVALTTAQLRWAGAAALVVWNAGGFDKRAVGSVTVIRQHIEAALLATVNRRTLTADQRFWLDRAIQTSGRPPGVSMLQYATPAPAVPGSASSKALGVTLPVIGATAGVTAGVLHPAVAVTAAALPALIEADLVPRRTPPGIIKSVQPVVNEAAQRYGKG